MTEQEGQSQHPRVADMLSRYGPPKKTNPTPVREDTSKGQSNKSKLETDEDKTPQSRTDGPTSPIPFKVIQVSPSGEVVDESDPRCSRIMDHYSRSTGHHGLGKPSKVPPIKPIAFTRPAYGSTKPPNNKTGLPVRRASKGGTSTVLNKIYTGSSTSSVGATSPAHTTGDAKDDTAAATRHSQVVAIQSMGGVYYKKVSEEAKHTNNNHIPFRTKQDNASTSKSSPPSPRSGSTVYEPGGMWFTPTDSQTTSAIPCRANIKRSQSLASRPDKGKPGAISSRRRSCRSSLILDYESDRPSILALPSHNDTVSITGSDVTPPVEKEMPATVGTTPDLERKSIPARVTLQQAPAKSYVKVVSQASDSKDQSKDRATDNQTSTPAKSKSTSSPKRLGQTSIPCKKAVSPVTKRSEKKQMIETEKSSPSSSSKQSPKRNHIKGQSGDNSGKQETSTRTPPSPKHSDDNKSSTLPIRKRMERYSSSQPPNPATPPSYHKMAYKLPTHKSQLPAKDKPTDTQRPQSPTSIDCIPTPPVMRKFEKDNIKPSDAVSLPRSQSQDNGFIPSSRYSLTPPVGKKRKGLAPPVHQKPMRSKSFERKSGPPTLPKPNRLDNAEQKQSLPRHTSVYDFSNAKTEDLTPPTQSKADTVAIASPTSNQKFHSPRMAKKDVASTDTSSSDRINEVFKSALDMYSSGMSVKSRIALFQDNTASHRQKVTKSGPTVDSKMPCDAKTSEKAAENLQLSEAMSEDGRESVSPQPRMRIASTKDDQPEDNSIDIKVFDEGIGETIVQETSALETEIATNVKKNKAVQSCDSDTDTEAGKESTPEIKDNNMLQTELLYSQSEGNFHRRFSTSPIYSYQEYASQRKRNSLPGINVQVEATKSLEDIPEVAQPLSPFFTSDLTITEEDTKPEKKRSNSTDSDGGLMPDVSGSFFNEVFSSLTTVIGESGSLSSEEIARVVNGMVSFKPKLSNQAEDIYESVEAYSYRVSHYFSNMHEQDEEEEPPDLPPRPVFLQKLITEEQEEDEISILSDKEYDLRPRAQTMGNIFLDCNDPSRSMAKSPSKMKRLFGRSKSKSPEAQDGHKQGKKKRSFLSTKIEPSHQRKEVHRMDNCEYDAESMHDDMNYEHHEIHPYEASGSEPEDNQEDMISRDTISSGSATKLTRGSIDDVFPSHTPDSEVYPDDHDVRRYTRDHLTPPLVTKIGTLPSNGMKYSTSDPSLHATVISTSFRRKAITITQSSSFTKAEPNNDSSDTNSLTPSISSFESGRLEQSPYSPAMRKRVKSDVSHDRNSLAAKQKYLLRKKNVRPESSQV